MKLFKKIIFWVLATLLIFVIQGIALVYIYEDDIKQTAIKNINSQINTEIKVNKIELTYFQHFPYVSLKFPDVIIYGSTKTQDDILLNATELSLLFNIWDIYKENYTVKKLYIKNANWTSSIDLNGISNFNILKQDSTNTDKDSDLNLKIEEIELENCMISHADYQSKLIFKSKIPKLKAKGDFQSENFNLSVNSNLNVLLFEFNKVAYLTNKNLNLNTDFNIDLKNEIINFENSNIGIEKLKLQVAGFVNLKEQKIKLNTKGDELNVQSFISLLPYRYKQKFDGITGDGKMHFSLLINGDYSKDHIPDITVDAGFNKVDITINTDKIEEQNLKSTSFKFTYKNNSTPGTNDDIVKFENINCTYHQNLIKANLLLRGIENPYIDFDIETNQDLTEIQKIWKIKNVEFKGGRVSLKLNIKSYLSELKKDNNVKEISSIGTIVLNNVSLKPGKYALDINDLNGVFNFQKADLKINEMSFVIGNSDFNLTGYFRNLFSYILTEGEDLQIDAILKSTNIDLKELLGSAATATNEEPYKLKISNKISANLKLNVKKLTFEPFKAFDLSGEMQIKDKIINTDYIAFRSQNGLVFSKINFNTNNQNVMPMHIDLNLNKVDVSNLFREFNNFGLEIITDKNLKGIISSKLKIEMIWDENLNSNHDKFTASGSILIENGELLNFKPMLALGKYIDVNELNNLKFSNLENNIEIKNKTISIPDMEVKSNALNLRLSGTHSFDNKIEYHLQLLLSDFIRRKSKRLGDERFGEIEPDGSGNTKLFIKMYGDATNPNFSLDKQMIRKKLADDLKNEKSEVKKVLKEEFDSWFKKEREFKDQISEEKEEWENDIPQKNLQNKSVSSSSKSDSLSNTKKSKLQKLKDKLKEKPEDDEQIP